jgi:hypothetical protein
LWASAAAAAILLAGGGYLAFTASGPTSVGTAALSLSAEQLELALAERRKADTFAAEKRRLEDEARQKAEAEAEAKRQAESELEQARQARQKAEQELAELKARIAAGHAQAAQQDQAAVAAQRAAEEAAQHKAEADAAALRQAEEEAQKKLEVDTEAKRQADEALTRLEAERQKAEQEARQKAEAEQVALRQSSEVAQRKAAEAESVRKAEAERTKAEADRQKAEGERQKAEAEAKVRADAETAEKALRLDQPGRERVQRALTSLGFDTRGTDGIFGTRSREMLLAWQKARNQPATGFLNTAQQEMLLKEAALALSKHDDQKKAEEEAKLRTVPATPVLTGVSEPASPAPGPSVSGASQRASPIYDGTYTAEMVPTSTYAGQRRVSVSLQVTNSRGAGSLTSAGCRPSQFSLSISPTGEVSGEGYLNCVIGAGTLGAGDGVISGGPMKIHGSAQGRSLQLTFLIEQRPFRVALNRGTATPQAPLSPDGLWRGTYTCTAVSAAPLPNFTLDLDLKLANGISTGGGFPESHVNARTLNIEVSVNPPNVTVTRTYMTNTGNSPVQRGSLPGQFDGTSIRASGRQFVGSVAYDCTLTLARVP